MDIKNYFHRIGYAGPVAPTATVLASLQLQHLLSVPFENLDIHNHVKIDLFNLYDKIVTRKRGGFCYELNGLFYHLLKATGFRVRMVSAMVYDGNGGYSPPFDHMAMIATIAQDEYLVDAGFGDFSVYPIKNVAGEYSIDPSGIFNIEPYDNTYRLVTKKVAGGIAIPQYIFDPAERQLDEFFDRCNFHQSNPESHFMKNRLCSLLTPNGRITLTGNRLKKTANGSVEEITLANGEEVERALRQYFGVEV